MGLVVGLSSAQAEQARLFAGTFGESTSNPVNPYPLVSPRSLSVDESTHDVYVSDIYYERARPTSRVEKFDATGHLILIFGKNVNKTAVENPGSTEAERDVCTVASGDKCTNGENSFSEHDTPLEEPAIIAVDNSSDSSKGDIYVSTGAGTSIGSVYKLDSSGHVVSSWATGGGLDGSAVITPASVVAGPFGAIGGIYVDGSGHLWVASSSVNGSATFKFDQNGVFLSSVTVGGGFSFAVGIDESIYLRGSGSVIQYNPAGKEVGVVAPARSELEAVAPRGIAIDKLSGDLYVDGVTGAPYNDAPIIKRYDASCRPTKDGYTPQPGCVAVESFGVGLTGSPQPEAMAIDASNESIFVINGSHVARFSREIVPDVATTKPVVSAQTSAILTGTINPSGIETNVGSEGCRFEWGEFGSPYEHTVLCDKTAAQIGAGNVPVEVRASIAGLQAGKSYHYRLVGANANDVNGAIDEPSLGKDVTFGPPLIEHASAVEVASTGAFLQVQVDANALDTNVRVEYGTEAGVYTSSTSTLDFGSADVGKAATFGLTELESGTVYHYRVVAENVLGEGVESVVGRDKLFATQAVSDFALLDHRGWELVSPPDKHGAGIQSMREDGVTQAAADGSAISYLANASTEVTPQGNASAEVQVLSKRSTAGWSSLDIATPHETPVGTPAGPGPEYKFFSNDLSLAVTEPVGDFVPSISTEASEKTPYLRTDFQASSPGGICSTSCYRPLVSGKPGFANVPSGTEFGEKCSAGGVFCGPRFLGASADASHIVLQSNASLVEGAPGGSLYMWSGGVLQLVSIFPGASGIPAPAGTMLGSGGNTRKAISANGSRVVWASAATLVASSHLYLRDIGRGETVQLDRVSGGSGKGVVAPTFESASSDDSVIFFTDTQRLTANSGASANNPDLYRCQLVTNESEEHECALTDITPMNGSESADVLSPTPGVSEDGSFVYFFADGVLARNSVDNGAGNEEARPADCGAGEEKAGASKYLCNLYVYHGGTTTFVAALSSADLFDWTGLGLKNQPTRVAPNGEWLEFMSGRALTAYDNRSTTTGAPAAEVYLYSAASGRVLCASCDPTGARPHGIEYNVLLHGLTGGFKTTWITDGLVAAIVPATSAINDGIAGYQDRYLSDSGRLFFDATDGLVPHDSNGTVDVYEYEPAGVGTCSESTATFDGRSDGCVDLVSSGTSGLESAFLDASETGDDVFFLTSARLSYRDTDAAIDVYDAHVGGGETEPVKPVECQGDACQSFVEAPNDPTPGSLTFQGPGNVLTQPAGQVAPRSTQTTRRKCSGARRMVHGKCVKKKAKRKIKVKKSNRGRITR